MTRVVEIKKSALAQFRGLGLSVAEIANKYGISEKDAKQILVQAG
jgi:DNA-directed RNA polymerase specialized sigma24 family protein